MKISAMFRAIALLAGICGLVVIHGCGGGGGSGGGITPTANAPSIATASLPAGVRGQQYSVTLGASGGTTPYGWSATGLPPGISLDSATGVLSGTPTMDNSYTPTITVTDNAGLVATLQLTLVIQPATSLVLIVADYSTPSGAVDMFDNAGVADGASAWTRQFKGALTTLDNAAGGPPAGVSYDAARNILYVARTRGSDNGAVLAFQNADAADGDIAPTRTIGLDTFSLNSPNDVFIDSGNDRIYIADVLGTIIILNSASATPSLRRIIGLGGGLIPAAISVDVGRDILYVVPNLGTGIIAYDNVSTGSSPQRTITIGSATGLVDVKIDPASNTAYVADYDGGRVFVINNLSRKDGTYAPDRTLTGLTNPNSVFPDVANDRLYVSYRDGATSYSVRVVENMSSVNGPVSFSRRLSGFGVAAGMTGFYK